MWQGFQVEMGELDKDIQDARATDGMVRDIMGKIQLIINKD